MYLVINKPLAICHFFTQNGNLSSCCQSQWLPFWWWKPLLKEPFFGYKYIGYWLAKILSTRRGSKAFIFSHFYYVSTICRTIMFRVPSNTIAALINQYLTRRLQLHHKYSGNLPKGTPFEVTLQNQLVGYINPLTIKVL